MTSDARSTSSGRPTGEAGGTLALAMLSTTTAVLPNFLLGALAVLVRRDLHFSAAVLGGIASVWFTVAAITSIPAGRTAERIGASRAMGLAALVSTASLGGIGLLATRWWHVAVLIGFAALGNALAQPAANLALAREMPEQRMGIAFGIKQSAVPMASFLGGFAVPAIGLTVGWRWAFIGAGAGTLGFAWILFRSGRRRPVPTRGTDRTGDVPARSLTLLGVAGGLGVVAANSLGIFYVDSAVTQGHSNAMAGIALALGSLTSIGFRVLWGWLADRMERGRLGLVTALLLAGSVGIALLGFAGSTPILAVATVLAFGAAWGWAGVFHFSVVRLNPGAPAAATGIVMTAIRTGGIVGPLLIGFTAAHASYRLGWLLAAGMLAMASATMHLGRLSVRRWRASLLTPEAGAQPAG